MNIQNRFTKSCMVAACLLACAGVAQAERTLQELSINSQLVYDGDTVTPYDATAGETLTVEYTVYVAGAIDDSRWRSTGWMLDPLSDCNDFEADYPADSTLGFIGADSFDIVLPSPF
jgi:hypothetical protein